MTTNKDFKRLVRERMRTTGESYMKALKELTKPTAAAERYECVECGWPWPSECVCPDGGRERPVAQVDEMAKEKL